MMRVAFFVCDVLAALAAAGSPGLVQEPARSYRLGVLSPSAGTFQRMRQTLLPELAKLGFVEGGNLSIETRFGPTEQLPALARELVAARPQVVLATGAFAIRAVRATGPTPVVGSFIGEDPIAAGFAKNLARPGGDVTGIVMLAPELDAKRLDMLHSAVPSAHRIAALAVNPERGKASIAAMREVAARLGLEVLPFYAAASGDYPKAFDTMRTEKIDALEIVSAPEFFTDAKALAALAIAAKLPTICEWRSMANDGCLLGYGPDFHALLSRTAEYVARILRGAAPGDLPIEGPTRFDFAINQQTAKTIGLAIPQSILARADEVVE